MDFRVVGNLLFCCENIGGTEGTPEFSKSVKVSIAAVKPSVLLLGGRLLLSKREEVEALWRI